MRGGGGDGGSSATTASSAWSRLYIGTWCLEEQLMAAARCAKLAKLLPRQAGAIEAVLLAERWNMYWFGVSKLLEDT